MRAIMNRSKMLKQTTLLAALALSSLPLAASGQGMELGGDPCGALPGLMSELATVTTVARDLIQNDVDRYDVTGGYPGAPGFSLRDLNYVLDVLVPTYSPFAGTAASLGTPGGAAWAYQVHAGVIYSQGFDAEFNDAEHWAITSAVYNQSQDGYDAVGVIVDAHNIGTKLDLQAMRCYMSAYGPFHR
jgi:hypothetical protein